MDTYLRRLFLFRCFREYKLLFFLCIIFIGAAFYGHRSSCEITPALVLGMYTSTEQTRSGDFMVIMADDRPLDLHHTLDEPRRMMIYSTLSAFYQAIPYQGAPPGSDPKADAVQDIVRKHPFIKPLASHALNSSKAYEEYLPWLASYVRQAVDKQIHHLAIYQLHVHYDNQNLPVADYRKLLYELELPPLK